VPARNAFTKFYWIASSSRLFLAVAQPRFTARLAAHSLFSRVTLWGENLELVSNQRIVQAWRVVTWPEGIYSIARFELVAQTSAGQSSATRIIFDHTGFPAELAEHLESGWRENYWDALRKYLA
jgi:Activator of Hsp90 ATPase homolog 1-like protein